MVLLVWAGRRTHGALAICTGCRPDPLPVAQQVVNLQCSIASGSIACLLASLRIPRYPRIASLCVGIVLGCLSLLAPGSEGGDSVLARDTLSTQIYRVSMVVKCAIL